MANNVIDLRGGNRPRKRESAPRQSSQKKEKRPAPLRVRRRRLRLAALAVLLVVVALAAYTLHRVSYSPSLNISKIDVVGAEHIDPSVISGYIETQLHDGKNHFLSRSNIFVFPQTVLERGSEASFPRVNSAVISHTGFSTAITVTIDERAPYSK